MFNLGFGELLLLAAIALVFIGPQQLPEIARTLGRMLNEWKRATSDFQSTVTQGFKEDLQNRVRPEEPTPSTEPVVAAVSEGINEPTANETSPAGDGSEETKS